MADQSSEAPQGQASSAPVVQLNPLEEKDIHAVHELMGALMDGASTMDEVLEALKKMPEGPPKGYNKRGKKTQFMNLILRQRLRQLVQKYLGSALIKDGRTADLRKKLDEVEAEHRKLNKLSQEKTNAMQRVEELQAELANAVREVEHDVDKETINMDVITERAAEIVAKKKEEVVLAKQKLEELELKIAEYSQTLEEQQEKLRAVRDEDAIRMEEQQHEQLMEQLRSEVEEEKKQQDAQLEAIKASLLEQTETQINDIIESNFQKELDKAAKEEQELEEKIYAETIALQAAREKLELMLKEEQLKDLEIEEQVAGFDVRVEETLAPLRDELDELRKEIHASQVHANRKEEMDKQLARLKRELSELEEAMKKADDKMKETQQEFEQTIAQVRKDKSVKLQEAKQRFEEFKEEVKEREDKVNLGLDEQHAIERQAELKKLQVDNLYSRIAQLETGLKLKSSDIDLLQREINMTNESTRVHTEELYMAEKLQETAQKEQDIKVEMVKCLEEKLQIVQQMRENVEVARATVKDHVEGSDAVKKAMEAMKNLDQSKLKVLEDQVQIRKEEVSQQKDLTKNVREEIDALEKIRDGVQSCIEATEDHKATLDEHHEWQKEWSQKFQKLPEKSIEKALLPRMAATVKSIDADIKALKALNYAIEDRVAGVGSHVEVMQQRVDILEKMREKLEKDKELAESKKELLQNEVANTQAETEVQQQRKSLLEADIQSHIERTKLLSQSMANTEQEMRLHKMSASIWQGKIKVVRDDTKVRDARIKVLDVDISRLKDLNENRQKTLDMLEALDRNYKEAIEFNEEEAQCLDRQIKSMKAKGIEA